MNKGHKIIKYFAIAFALSLIFGMLMFAVKIVDVIIPNRNTNEEKETTKTDVASEKDTLYIELRASNLIIKEGEKFLVDVNNKYVDVVELDNKLSIIERKHSILNGIKDMVTVYIPKNTNFGLVDISNGAGNIMIESINTNLFNLEVGAGKVEIDTLNVSKSADIEGGAGKISILSGNINNLDLDLGVGEFNLEALLTGNNDIESGVGSVNIKLLGTSNDYKIKTTKGLGSIMIDNINVSNDTVYENGNNLINIDGGIGSVNIKFKEEINSR